MFGQAVPNKLSLVEFAVRSITVVELCSRDGADVSLYPYFDGRDDTYLSVNCPVMRLL